MNPQTIDWVGLLLALLAVTGGQAVIRKISSSVAAGSDHVVHMFLVDGLRRNGHCLNAKVPGLLLTTEYAAYPPYLHWVLSFLPQWAVDLVVALLNPVVNALLVIGTFGMVRTFVDIPPLAGLASLTLALTPQYYDPNSARARGLSIRAAGLLVMSGVLALLYGAQSNSRAWWLIMLAAGVGFPVWGLNRFAQQAFTLFTLFFALSTGDLSFLWAYLGSIALFVLIGPTFAVRSFKYSFEFWREYALEKAQLFILHYRYSVWRDLVWDIWVQIAEHPLKGFYYAYNNNVVRAVFFNTVALLAGWLAIAHPSGNSFLQYSGEVSLAGLFAFLLTSLRPTRFLGEPERYLELAAPFASVCVCAHLLQRYGSKPVLVLCGILAVVCICQIAALFLMLRGKPNRRNEAVLALPRMIERHFHGEDVRIASTDFELVRMLLQHGWGFVMHWVGNDRIGGCRTKYAFDPYPIPTKAALEGVMREQRINVFIRDRKYVHRLFDWAADDAPLMELLGEAGGYELLRVSWPAH